MNEEGWMKILKRSLFLLLCSIATLSAFDYNKVELIASGYNNGLDWFPNPAVYDINKDGLKDILVGVNVSNTGGKIRVLENVGSDTVPEFTMGDWLTNAQGNIITTSSSG